MLKYQRWTAWGASLAVMAMVAAPASAGDKPDLSRFPLLKTVPQDVFITVAARKNAERKFLDEHWAEVCEAFWESGVTDDVWEMIAGGMDDKQSEALDELCSRLKKQWSRIDWDGLLSNEIVFTGRMLSVPTHHYMGFDGLLIARCPAGKAGDNFDGLKGLLDEVASLINDEVEGGAVAVTESEVQGARVVRFGPTAVPGIGLSVAQKGDVVILAAPGTSLLEESLALLAGESKEKGLAATPRFTKAFEGLPPGEDSVVFFDVDKMMGSIKKVFGSVKQMAGREDPDAEKAMSVLSRLIDDLSFIDYVAEVEWTDGRRVFSDSVAKLAPGAKQCGTYPVFVCGQTVSKFDRFVPKETDSFSSTSGINWKAAYRYVLDFVKKNVPDVEEGLDQWAELQTEWELDVEKDVLGNLAGPMSVIQLGDHMVIMIAVNDTAAAEEQIARLVDMVKERTGEGGGLAFTSVTLAGKHKFTQINHPMMMMMGGMSPVWGCAENHLIIGTSSKAVEQCLKTASGDHPSILENERFKKEALLPAAGDLDSISFTDERNFGGELQEAVGGMAMGLGMAGMFMQGGDVPEPVRNIITGLGPILGKLGPVAGMLDFYQSSASCTTFAGDHWYTRSVQNYKEPRARDEEEAAGNGRDTR